MAGSVNKVILVGNVGNDPEIRNMQSGDRVCNLSLATSESWTDKATGERQERTQWHRVVIFNQGILGIAERFVKKGSKIYIEGQLETRKWTDQSGVEKYSTEVVLRPYRGELTLLDSKGSSGGNYANNDMDQSMSGGGNYGGGAPARSSGGPATAAKVDEFEDEIPF